MDQPSLNATSNKRPCSLTPQQSFVMPHGTPSPSRRIIEKRTIEQQQQESTGLEKKPRTTLVPKYSTVGQFSYAPATQTTVVTTTTTTTTHFPLLQMHPPRHLNELDPKQYPLATQPTPSNLKRFCFDVDGRPTYFREAEDPDLAVEDMDQLMENLRKGGGTICKVEKSEEMIDVPEHYMKTPTSATMPETIETMGSASRKRPASPVSLSEAAERVATMQKGSKRRQTAKTRPSILSSLNTTPSSIKKGSRGKSGVASSSAAPLGDADSPTNARSTQWPIPQHLPQSSHARTLFSPGRIHTSQQQETPITQSPQLLPAEQERAIADLALVTVKDEENILMAGGMPDVTMDTVDTPTSEAMAITVETSTREGSSTLSVEQPLSLPSPSLSPVTAALTHGNSGYFSPAGDDDITSPFELGPSDGQNREQELQLVRSPRSNHFQHLGRRSLLEIPNMIDSFDSMPPQLQSYVLFHLLRRSPKSALQMVASVVNPALKCDFISTLPLELSLSIIQYLDYKSLCSAAQVSKKWRMIIDSDEWTWKKRFEEDGYVLAEGELERAVNEGWGYQIPRGNDDCERDIRKEIQDSRLFAASINNSPSKVQKRKTRAMAKQQKKKQEAVDKLGKEEFNELLAELSNNDWPSTVLGKSPALTHILGLPQLRIHHLYKSIYRRHHLIRKSWIKPDMEPRHISFRGHQRHVVTCLQFDTDKILTGSDDNNINVYDTNTGALRNTLVGHEGGVWALQYEGNTLVSGSTDRTVRVWDIATGNCTQIFHGHTSTVRCLQILMPTKVGVGLDGRDKMMPKTPLIITGSRDSTLRIWKLPQPGDRPYLPENGGADGTNLANNPYFVRMLSGHQHSVRAIAAHGDTLVSGSYDYTVRVWRISTGETVHRLAGHTQKVYSVVLDTKRNRCISGSMDNLVRVWSLETGTLIHTLEGHTSLVGLLDLSHDHLVSAAADSTLRIWDPESGQCKHVLSAHTGAITCFQHDGHKVISGSDGTLKMWNVRTGQFVRDLLTDLSGVWQVKFNERRCVAAVQRESITYIEVLDFGAARDGIPDISRGRRIVVDANGNELPVVPAAAPEAVEA